LDGQSRICNYCKEAIDVNLRRCPYCGSLLRNTAKEGDGDFSFNDKVDISFGNLKYVENIKGERDAERVESDAQSTEKIKYESTVGIIEETAGEVSLEVAPDSENATDHDSSALLSDPIIISAETFDMENSKPDIDIKDDEPQAGSAFKTDESEAGSVKKPHELTTGNAIKTDEPQTGSVVQDEYSTARHEPTAAKQLHDMERSREVYNRKPKRKLGNGMKVFLTVLCTIIPGIGQLAGVIIGIAFMAAEDDDDSRTFGTALMIASVIMFFISCVFYAILSILLVNYNVFGW